MSKNKGKGWIKLYRKTLQNPEIMGYPNRLSVFIYLLLNAVREPVTRHFDGKEITLKPGELITGRRKIAETTGMSEDAVERALKALEAAQVTAQVTAQVDKRCGRVISILAWDEYQRPHKRPHKRPHTIQEVKEVKEYNNNNIYNNICVSEKNRKGCRRHTHPYGKLDNVYLTADEYQDLKDTYVDSRKLINNVSVWLANNERDNHYAVCLKFAESDSYRKVHLQDTAPAAAKELSAEEKAEADKIMHDLLERIGHGGRKERQV